MSSGDDIQRAIVLSGGSSQGAYHAGVLKALFNGKSPATNGERLDPDVISGTSAGAFNGTALLAQIEAGNPNPADYIEEIWLNRIARTGVSCGNGVFRVRGNLAKFTDAGCLFSQPFRPVLELVRDASFFAGESVERGRQLVTSTERIGQRILDQFNLSTFVAMDPFREAIKHAIPFEVLQRPKETSERRRYIRIGAVRLDTGVVRYFDREDLTVDVGPKIVQASAAIPGLFPRVEVNGIPYGDGGIIENTPLQGAVEADADVVHVVTSFPKATNIPPDTSVNTLDTLWRMLVINVSAAVERDVQRIANINAALKVVEMLSSEGSGDASRLFLQSALDGILRRSATDYRQITVHVHRPPESIGSLMDMLNFDREYLQTLVRAGYHDTVSHNCEVNGCVLPI